MHMKQSQEYVMEAGTLDLGKTKTLVETDRSHFEEGKRSAAATLNDEDYKL